MSCSIDRRVASAALFWHVPARFSGRVGQDHCGVGLTDASVQIGKTRESKMTANVIVIACGVLALLYGWVTSRQVLAADAGSARMQPR